MDYASIHIESDDYFLDTDHINILEPVPDLVLSTTISDESSQAEEFVTPVNSFGNMSVLESKDLNWIQTDQDFENDSIEVTDEFAELDAWLSSGSVKIVAS